MLAFLVKCVAQRSFVDHMSRAGSPLDGSSLLLLIIWSHRTVVWKVSLGDCDAIIIKDLFSKVKALFPVFSKTGQEAENVLRKFFGDKKVEVFFSDNAPELKLACKSHGIVHELSP